MSALATAKLEVDVGAGLVLRNPVIAASGTFGYGVEYAGVTEIRTLGAVVVKGISLRPSAGHPAPRLVETAAGMLNAIGLQNIGLDRFVSEKLPWLRERGVTVVVNWWGNTVEEYAEIVSALDTVSGVAAIEVNISSPNKREWGGIIATDSQRTRAVVAAARAATRRPLWVKLSPNVGDIAEVARVAEDAGADTLCVANTYIGMAVDLRKRRPVLSNVTGGLSGPAIDQGAGDRDRGDLDRRRRSRISFGRGARRANRHGEPLRSGRRAADRQGNQRVSLGGADR